MALYLKPKTQTLTLITRPFSSSSSYLSSPPPPPPDDSNGNQRKSPSFSSNFSDIKQSLKYPSPPPRHTPTNPNPNPNSSSLNDILKDLAECRLKPQNPNPGPNRNPNPNSAASFQDIFKNTVAANSPDPKTDPGRFFDSIRKSLRGSSPRENISNRSFQSSFNLKSFQESLRSPSVREPASPLPDSIFGRELREKNKVADAAAGSEGGAKVLNTEFVKMYSYDELGEKLRQLRPAGAAGKEGKDWFSLEELNRRLAKLREMEEKETQDRMGGVLYQDIRESLFKLREADTDKKLNRHRLSIMANLGMNATPSFMLKPPQEQLMENYFHPDHLSSEEKMKIELKKVRDEFKMSESDCGSSRVQIAQLTTKIKHLSSVLHKKDKHSRKGLHEMVQRRKKLLKYLRRTDWESYCFVLSKLGLRDVPEYKTPNYKA